MTERESMKAGREKFGAFIRREREAKEIGLREMAKKIGVSPTYLSLVELDRLAPPAEDRVKGIAKVLGCNPDELMARAHRVPSDVTEAIKRRPKLAELVRGTTGISDDEIERFLKSVCASRNTSNEPMS
jgi:transcriptional regulator with XRE-family HTH domain